MVPSIMVLWGFRRRISTGNCFSFCTTTADELLLVEGRWERT